MGKNLSDRRNTLINILFVVYILVLTGIILFKLPFYSPVISDGIRAINLVPLMGSFDENGILGLREITDNIMLFVPFGIYISVLKSEWPILKRVLSAAGLSLTFEVLQFIFALGRTDVTDILGNTFGGVIGICVYALALRILKDRTFKAINIVALVLTVCVVSRFIYQFYVSYFVMSGPGLSLRASL